MTTWNQALREGALSGSLASLLSTAYLAWCGHRRGEAAAPLNAVSHWFFGDRALREGKPRPLYTATGFVIHHAASIFWGVLHAKAWPERQRARRPMPAAAAALATSSMACLVDYQLTPRRLNPGFEQHLSNREMVNLYALFAVGLVVGSLCMRSRRGAPGAQRSRTT